MRSLHKSRNICVWAAAVPCRSQRSQLELSARQACRYQLCRDKPPRSDPRDTGTRRRPRRSDPRTSRRVISDQLAPPRCDRTEAARRQPMPQSYSAHETANTLRARSTQTSREHGSITKHLYENVAQKRYKTMMTNTYCESCRSAMYTCRNV